ncbi:MAG: hypothetical protein KC910_27035 [Candidatus Eremiobacteraeota bacterium]|nr:hypothetical protein [Candidatus Eremiobacteraeota bacterium]
MSPVTFSPATRSANLSRQAPPRASASPPEPRPDQVNLEPTSLAPARSDKKWLLPFGIIAGLGVAAAVFGGGGSEPQQIDLSQVHGRIQFVTVGADYDVKVVDHFGDLRVQKVDHFPDGAGEWQIVDHFPDYKIRLVNVGEDFSIQWVDHFPGLP